MCVPLSPLVVHSFVSFGQRLGSSPPPPPPCEFSLGEKITAFCAYCILFFLLHLATFFLSCDFVSSQGGRRPRRLSSGDWPTPRRRWTTGRRRETSRRLASGTTLPSPSPPGGMSCCRRTRFVAFFVQCKGISRLGKRNKYVEMK